MNPARGSLLGIEHLEAAEILRLLKFARRMNPDKPRPLLKGKRVLLLFYEASTRTRSSFEIAAKSMGAHTVLIQSAGSSIEKGESLLDTGYTVRAVGAANGRNPLSIVVPCHRVIGADGSLTGFGGGIERKRWLLQHEGALLI